jgi:hypothetical protein
MKKPRKNKGRPLAPVHAAHVAEANRRKADDPVEREARRWRMLELWRSPKYRARMEQHCRINGARGGRPRKPSA